MDDNQKTFLGSLFLKPEPPRKKVLKSIKAKADSKRNFSEKAADKMVAIFGSISFFLINAVVFIVWILINTGNFFGVKVFDAFPFSLLTTIVSLEAIVLAIFVLISQNRSIKIDDLREEIHLQINIVAEKEITKVMKMMSILLEKQGIKISEDPELKHLLKPISEEELQRTLEKEIF
jgi:uncharacterized membrane protein